MKKKKTGIIVRTAELKDGVYDFAFESHGAELELPDNFTEMVNVRVQIEKLRQRYIIHVTAATAARFECDRCVREIVLPVDASFEMLFTSDQNEVRQIGEDAEVKLLDVRDHAIDLNADVREYLLLAIPLRKVCGEDEQGKSLCRDIPPDLVAREKESGDPRWAELKDLDLSGEEE